MTQGDPLSPIIYNLVVDAVVHHWIFLVEGVTGGQDGWVMEVQYRATFFCTDDSLDASTDPIWLQRVFDTLAGLFDRVELWTNVEKMFGILFFPCCAAGTQSEEAYKHLVTGGGTHLLVQTEDKGTMP